MDNWEKGIDKKYFKKHLFYIIVTFVPHLIIICMYLFDRLPKLKDCEEKKNTDVAI